MRTVLTRLHAARDEDAGVTLLEVVVGMMIMSVFLAMFTGAFLTLIRTQTRAEASTGVASQTDVAFQRLDRQVRYASSVSSPGIANGAWWVEFLTSTNPNAPTCTQLRVSTTKLERRSWTVTAAGLASPANPTWTPLASGVTNGSAASGATGTSTPPAPFTLVAVGTSSFEQLTVRLVVSGGNPAVTTGSTQTFTALNSSPASQAAGSDPTAPSRVCTQVARS